MTNWEWEEKEEELDRNYMANDNVTVPLFTPPIVFGVSKSLAS